MSSTRVAARRGKHLDFYETPAPVTHALLDTGLGDNMLSVLEPCAGRGAILRAWNERYPDVSMTCVEIQEEYTDALRRLPARAIICGDFLKLTPQPVFDLVLCNPPFSQAEEFVRTAWEWLAPAGQMAFLLRLPFLASVKRYRLFEAMRPCRVHVLSQRPKFGGANIDSCDYAWFVWSRAFKNSITWLDWLLPVQTGAAKRAA